MPKGKRRDDGDRGTLVDVTPSQEGIGRSGPGNIATLIGLLGTITGLSAPCPSPSGAPPLVDLRQDAEA